MTTDAARPGRRPCRLLFVCVENCCRSQMAEAFARLHGGGRVEACSAGTHPSGRVHPKAAAAMREVSSTGRCRRPATTGYPLYRGRAPLSRSGEEFR